MRRFAILVAFLAATIPPAMAADPGNRAPSDKQLPKNDAASLEKAILDSPGPVGCWTNNTGDRIYDCEAREKGITAFKKLYESDKDRAIAAIEKRFAEIPSPKGGYFPILAAVQVKDKKFLPSLKKLATEQKENALGTFASEAIRLIETGKCSKVPPPPNLRELCM